MAKSPTEKMASYRARLRAQGLRPVQIWAPDTRAPGFAESIRRQSLMLCGHRSDEDIADFLDAAAAEIEGWEA